MPHKTKTLFYIGFKVFMDARMPVTHEEGDRYPLEPPVLGFFQQYIISLLMKRKRILLFYASLAQRQSNALTRRRSQVQSLQDVPNYCGVEKWHLTSLISWRQQVRFLPFATKFQDICSNQKCIQLVIEKRKKISCCFCPTRIMVLRRSCNPNTAVRFCRGAPRFSPYGVTWQRPCFGSMWWGFKSLYGDHR